MLLINSVEEISKYYFEILENRELRIRELNCLEGYRSDSVQLLEQINISIPDFTKENITNFSEYKFSTEELDELLKHQYILENISEEVSELTYKLNRG